MGDKQISGALQSSNIIDMRGDENIKKCPLCNSGVRYFFVNFQEKLLLCENAMCEYPFGYDDLQFIDTTDDLHSCNIEQSMLNYENSDTTFSEGSSAILAEIEKMRNCESTSYVHDTKSITNEEDNALLKEVEQVRILNSTLVDLQKEDKKLYLKNETYIKNLLALQENSRIQLLKPEEMNLVKKDQQTEPTIKIDIDRGMNNAMSCIKIELSNKTR